MSKEKTEIRLKLKLGLKTEGFSLLVNCTIYPSSEGGHTDTNKTKLTFTKFNSDTILFHFNLAEFD